ncbi:MAG: HD-GYP domain-containing protein, partial [Candidatus Methylomirabilales bacterium]
MGEQEAARQVAGYSGQAGSYRVLVIDDEEVVRLVLSELQRAHELLKRSYLQTLSSMISALEARDAYTRGHSDRVAELAEKIGRLMGYQTDSLKILVDAARLHDLGKIGIREQVLNKQGPLSQDEYQHITRHPDLGADIVAHIEAYSHLVPIIRHHHERYDGRGY